LWRTCISEQIYAGTDCSKITRPGEGDSESIGIGDFKNLVLLILDVDLLCNVAYSAPIRTRRERADAVRSEGKAFFGKFTNGARDVLNELLEKYVEFGTAQFQIPDILKVPPISDHGNVMEIADLFGGGDKLREAVGELQELLYVA
jgi:hypothetical protein